MARLVRRARFDAGVKKTVLLILLGLIALPSPPAAAQSFFSRPAFTTKPLRTCESRGNTVLANRVARVYTIGLGAPEVHACVLGHRARRHMSIAAVRKSDVPRFQLAGRYVGWAFGTLRDGDLIEVQNAGDARDRHVYRGVAFALRSDGAVGLIRWLPGPTTDTVTPQVLVADRRHEVVLDQGDIDVRSLVLRGSRLYWMNAGQPKTGTFAALSRR